jgi:CheY-like chemotaxis protein
LPLVPGPDAAAADPGTTESAPRRVLVVDDNLDAADSLVELLELSGHRSEAAYSAAQALERADDADVVLLDIGLPGTDGYEVARRLRGRSAAHFLVAVTGYGQAADIERAHAAGFDAHLTKPVSFQDLQRVLMRGRPAS